MVESVRPLLMFQGRAEEAMTFFVECGSDEKIGRLAAALLDGGETFMPLDDYGFSPKVRVAQRPVRRPMAVEFELNSRCISAVVDPLEP